MSKKIIRWSSITVIILILGTTLISFSNTDIAFAQQPTGSIPTVTGTVSGPLATVKNEMEEKVNVRSGPSYFYDLVGVLLVGQSVPVIGKSIAGEWLKIVYPGSPDGTGWVFASYMDLTKGEIPIVEAPPLPGPKVTATIDPTMAAEFVVTPIPTRLPTYTASAPLTVPTFSDAGTSQTFAGIPVGLLIIVLAVLGIVVGLLTLFQSR